MATYDNLIIESDHRLSSKIGRVLFFDPEKNPNTELALGDIISKGGENLKIKSFEDVRHKYKCILGIRVEET